jgi:hypothetical protein
MTNSLIINNLITERNKIVLYNIKNATVDTLTNETNPLILPTYIKVDGVTKSNGAEVGVDISAASDAFATITNVDIHKHSWNNGEVITAASTSTCKTGLIKYTCTDPECGVTKEGILPSNKKHSSLTHSISEDGCITYTCSTCGCDYTPSFGYAMDGTDHNAMEGTANNTRGFATDDDSSNPVIKEDNGNKYYELIRETAPANDTEKQFQLWLPSSTYALDELSAENNAIGFLSFKINAYTDESFNMKFVDIKSNTGDNRWKAGGCIVDAFFTISKPSTSYLSKNKVKLTGWDGLELWYEKAGSDNFTGWIDVKMIIEFDQANDTVTVHYYIDGSYVGSKTKALTTLNNCVSGVYISGNTSTVGSGFMLDDVAFGCSFGKND